MDDGFGDSDIESRGRGEHVGDRGTEYFDQLPERRGLVHRRRRYSAAAQLVRPQGCDAVREQWSLLWR